MTCIVHTYTENMIDSLSPPHGGVGRSEVLYIFTEAAKASEP